jgi:hypothetical protein
VYKRAIRPVSILLIEVEDRLLTLAYLRGTWRASSLPTPTILLGQHWQRRPSLRFSTCGSPELHVGTLLTVIDSESVTTVLECRNNIAIALSVGLGCRRL